MSFSVVELIGYLASALVVASLAMTSVVRLRLISLAGSITFVVYGLLLPSIPIIITNACVALLNIWFLRKEFSGERDLNAVPVNPEAPFFADFLRSHEADIHKQQPGFDGVRPGDFALLLNRDGLPAGAYVGQLKDGTLELRLDYVLAPFRDSRLGQWLYGPGAKLLHQAGIRRVRANARTPSHADYLRSVGFTHEGDWLVRDV
ncbi:MAG: hypothetical protein WAV45_04495 [Propionibacteriaceae bacterium]|nr:hypothetical protein [Micropruina sp.]